MFGNGTGNDFLKDIEEEAGKEIDYSGIAIKGLLFHFKPCRAEISVKFSRPCAAQIDGETVLDVTEYKAVLPK